MKWYRIEALIARHVYLYKRSLPRLMDIFFWPTMDLLVWGFMSLYLQGLNLANVNIVSAILGAVIFWGILQQSQGSVSTTFLEDVWEKNLLNIFVTPLTILEFILATFGLVIVRVILGGVVMFALALLLYHFNIFVIKLAAIPFILNLIVFGSILGLFITSILLRFGTSAQVLAFGFIFLIQPFSAVFYPVSVLPHALQYISYVLPSTYVFEGLRALLNHGVFNIQYMIYAALLNVVYLAVVLALFYLAFAWVKKNGLLLKLN